MHQLLSIIDFVDFRTLDVVFYKIDKSTIIYILYILNFDLFIKYASRAANFVIFQIRTFTIYNACNTKKKYLCIEILMSLSTKLENVDH